MANHDLVLQTLGTMGCRCEEFNEDDKVEFKFQGASFTIFSENESSYIDIYRTWWFEDNLDDYDNVGAIVKAVNGTNLNCATTLVYSIDNENNVIGVHGKKCVPFLPSMPDLDVFLTTELEDFFISEKEFHEQKRALEEEKVSEN